jgi:DNA-binding CsgD family transcriptional regulator
MAHRMRSRLSPAEKTGILRCWKSGQSLHEIGRALSKPPNSIRCLPLPSGGIAPATRRRCPLTLKLAEREDISGGIASGSSIREVARRLDRASSTVSREVTRHGGRPAYRTHEANEPGTQPCARRGVFLL